MKILVMLVGLSLLLSSCGSKSSDSNPGPARQPAISNPFTGTWTSNCELNDDQSSSYIGVMEIKDSSLEVTDNNYANTQCQGAITHTSTDSLPYTLLSVNGSKAMLHVQYYDMSNGNPVLDTMFDAQDEVEFISPTEVKITVKSARVIDADGNLTDLTEEEIKASFPVFTVHKI